VPGFGLDDRPALWGADLLVAGEQADQRGGSATEAREGGEDEAVHRQAGLHVSDARTIGDAVTDGRGTAKRFAIVEDGVAMAHQHDVAAHVSRVGIRRSPPREGCQQAIAVPALRQHFDREPVALQEAAQDRTDRVDAGLVVAASVGFDHLAQQSDHGVLLGRQPGGDLGFGHLLRPSPTVVRQRVLRYGSLQEAVSTGLATRNVPPA